MTALEQICADAGLKMTGQRKTILKVLGEAEDHPSVETVYDRAKAEDSSISMATVYRTMNLLDELGIVVRHEFGKNYARYELNTEHHDHLIDLETGDILEFHSDDLETLKEKIANEMGFELVDHRLELYARKIKK
ncbi:MAG: transcriptional repressor [Rhodospirillales bacterium]|nr:transcriptional repressor [Rhodospirillales bacterium]